MSDNWIRVIPEDPRFVPRTACQPRARAWFERIAPDAEEIEIKTSDTVEFFDCGANFERILCSSCRAEIPVEWWQQRMDEDHAGGFKLLKYPTPCCSTPHTLHELVYEWPQGFGRFAIDVMNPGIGQLSKARTRELEQILGCSIRVIYQHI